MLEKMLFDIEFLNSKLIFSSKIELSIFAKKAKIIAFFC
jgi:hypothetical protein